MKTILTLLALGFFITSSAQENASRRRNFNHDNGVAMRDFDPVSYFKGGPLKGTSKYSFMHKGIEYYFFSEANLEEFKKAPAKYEPAYGGWCAYNMGVNGKRIKIDPSTYKIINGKLFLFSNFNGNNSLLRWNKEEKKLKPAADKFWSKNMN
jgi:YHS domain-containing protein